MGRWTGSRSVIGWQTGRKSAGREMGCKPGKRVTDMQRCQPAQPESRWLGTPTDWLAGRAGRARQAEKQTGKWSGGHEGCGDGPPGPKAHSPGPPGVALSFFRTLQGKAATPSTQPSLAPCIPLEEGNTLGTLYTPVPEGTRKHLNPHSAQHGHWLHQG